MLARLSQRNRDRLVDLGVFLFVVWFSLAQYGSQGFGEYERVATKPDALGFFLILFSALPLLSRRSHPWTAMAVAAIGGIALAACGYAVHVPTPLVAALYTFASRPDRGGLWPPIVFTAVAFAVQATVATIVMPLSSEEYVLPVMVLTGAWIIGERRRTAAQRRAEARERREREERLSIAEERTRIARELHDSAGHAINTIRVQAGAARVLHERDPERSRAAIEAIERLALETIEDIDRIVGSLRAEGPAERAPLPGIDRIPDLVAHQRDAGFAVELNELAEGERTPPPAVGRAAYRIAQEALTNAARHGSGAAELTVQQRPDRLEVTVVNPVPAAVAPAPAAPQAEPGEPTAPRPGGGLGLVGMRERAQLLGGTLEAGREDGRFRVRAILPYD